MIPEVDSSHSFAVDGVNGNCAVAVVEGEHPRKRDHMFRKSTVAQSGQGAKEPVKLNGVNQSPSSSPA